MNTNRIYTRKVNGLDNSVWFFMFIMTILSLGLLSFFWLDQSKCVEFGIKISPTDESEFYKGAPLTFSTTLSAKKNITWDFGDGSKNEKNAYVSHQFANAGKYYIKASINSNCDEVVKEITILKSFEELDNEDKIVYSGDLVAGKPIEFSCTKNADSWTWVVVDQSGIKPNSHAEKTIITFPRAGTYTVKVSLNADRTIRYLKEIVITDNRIKPKPVDIDNVTTIFTDQRNKKEKPATDIAPERNISIIGTKTFKDYLIAVLNQDNSRLSLEDFYDYLYRREDTDVKITGQAGSTKFNNFYSSLSSQRNKIIITDVKFNKDPNDPSKINFIIVTIEK
ncbi:MAG: PKD domain-containing protein [Ferruginibacter sp.]